MRHSAKAVLVLVAAMVAASIGSIAPAYAATIIVHPGESIQAAIDKAHAGDTIIVEPGVYHEILEITTNDITLKGSGASERGTELAPPVGPATNDCSNDPAETIGICIAGFGGPPVSDVTVQGFYIVGFSLFGGLAFNTQEAVFQHNAAVNDGEYGFFNNSSTQGKYLFNSASGATEAGFYIGDTDDADFTMVGNYSAKNTRRCRFHDGRQLLRQEHARGVRSKRGPWRYLEQPLREELCRNGVAGRRSWAGYRLGGHPEPVEREQQVLPCRRRSAITLRNRTGHGGRFAQHHPGEHHLG